MLLGGTGKVSRWFVPRRPTYKPKPVHMVFVVKEWYFKRGFQGILVFLCQYRSTNLPYTFIYHRRYRTIAVNNVAKNNLL